MQQKAFTLHNKGMNRDLSISKAGESSAYENHNIRILARDNDTMLSVTNERGNKEIPLTGIEGTLIGWNVLNRYIILFTTTTPDDNPGTPISVGADRIYRVTYKDDDTFENTCLYQGNLGFDMKHPIESIVYHETEDIQKIYWVDGKNVLRFVNFLSDGTEVGGWNDDSFDSNISADYKISVEITKDHSGNKRPNGVIQYLMTYYNKHGQETGYVWVSDLIYLSPEDKGGEADGENTCNVKFSITFDNDNKFTNFRIYSIFRSSLNKAQVAYIVAEGDIVTGEDDETVTVQVVDDASHMVTEDISRLPYLGSLDVHPYTITHKDQTLFLGGLEYTGQDYSWIKEFIENSNIYNPETGLVNYAPYVGNWVFFDYEDGPSYNENTGSYTYTCQLNNTSSDILSFKGGEKYRFAIRFQLEGGGTTPAFWIGDAINKLYPIIDANNNVIQRVVAKFVFPDALFAFMQQHKLVAAQLMIAEATYADRSVKAQGIINPTMFNVWERYNSRLYSVPSWISRPRRSNIASSHFSPVNNSIYSSGEIQCNYWETDGAPTPYYLEDAQGKLIDELDGIPDYDYIQIAYSYKKFKTHSGSDNDEYHFTVVVLVASGGSQPSHTFDADDVEDILYSGSDDWNEVPDTGGIRSKRSWWITGDYKNVWSKVSKFLLDIPVPDTNLIVSEQDLKLWFNSGDKTTKWRIQGNSATTYASLDLALNGSGTWNSVSGGSQTHANAYDASQYKKHLMFVDENVVTLNSPEFEYNAVAIDDQTNDDFYKLRIVGIAKITGSYSDYVVDASHGYASGENLVSASFDSTSSTDNLDGLTAWPLWKEFGLQQKDSTSQPIDIKNRTSDYYKYSSDLHKYWLYMWNHPGNIDGFEDSEGGDYSSLHSKTFATMHFSGFTAYMNLDQQTCDYSLDSIRMFNSVSSQYTRIKIGDGRNEYYDGNPEFSLSMPGIHKYPVLYSSGTQDTKEVISSEYAHLFINDPLIIGYHSNSHAVITLPTIRNNNAVTQTVLPYISIGGTVVEDDKIVLDHDAIIPWENDDSYSVSQDEFELYNISSHGLSFTDRDKYLLVGELYYDYSAEGAVDNRYGGISDFAVENCRFIPAGAMSRREDLKEIKIYPSPSAQPIVVGKYLVGDRGDTYFQRWDCMKTKPVSSNYTNSVIDVTSVMLETHINIDGRTDNYRGTKYLASVDPEKFGSLNPVYSQTDNFFSSRQFDEDLNQDTYHSSISWTLDKTDSAEIDEWTHITLANSLKLDGDKGYCRALRRFNNSIIAFQDRAISEILFNSRTQLSATDGVPVEIANSGKVDGKRYISNKYGCTNKWSIVDGKAALYFVDNINKAFCNIATTANGRFGIGNISSSKGFDVWFRRSNNVEPWTPDVFDNIVSFYDRIHSDVYLVSNISDDSMPCLVYNENIGTFTSFFDYESVPMMTNVDDRFVSFKNHKLWLQNEGAYCNFFNSQYDFWTTYRVTPDPFGDKIWTNVDYRADFYKVLDGNNNLSVPESLLINGEFYDSMHGIYQDNETFDSLRIWNEYQNTGEIPLGRNYTTDRTTRRKFRIWHVAIPRSQKSERNKWGLDRIRNPWINLMFKKDMTSDNNKDLMQLHDITVRYFE